MAAIVNSRDVLLQAANPRVIPVLLPSNVVVPQGNVQGLPAIVLNSKVIFLRASAQVFQIPKTGSVSPATITLTPIIRNVSGALVWNIIAGSATLGDGTGGEKTLAYTDMVTDTVTIRLTITDGGLDYIDTLTIVKLREGSDTINAVLSNESHTVSASSAGLVLSYSGASTIMSIFIGTSDTTASWAFSKVDGLGVTSSLSGNTVTLTDFQAAYDASYVDVKATRAGFANITRRFSLSKSKAGTSGSNGSNGSNGMRGSVTAYASGSSWGDSTANSAIISATSTVYKVIGDTVTISNNSTFAKTKYWSGGSWVDPGVIIDGNLLVNGTLSANAIYGGTLSAASIAIASSAGGWVFNAGYNGTTVGYRLLQGYNIDCGNLANPNVPTINASCINFSTAGAISGNGSSGPGVSGSNSSGASGVVGSTSGFDFYANGSEVNYGPFTGAHDAVWFNGDVVEAGDIVVDVECVTRNGLSNTIFRVERSSAPNQKTAFGVLVKDNGSLSNHTPAAFLTHSVSVRPDFTERLMSSTTPEYDLVKDLYQLGAVNALGEGQVNVCGENGDIVAGDYIVTSSMSGKGMRQSDDILRSCTVAKSREAATFDYPTQVKQIACFYVAG